MSYTWKTVFKRFGDKVILLLFLMTLFACKNEVPMSSINPVNWDKRKISPKEQDSLVRGSTYLSVYSQIYSQTESKTVDLTATVSLRNLNHVDTIYVEKAIYYDTHGMAIRTYFNETIFIAPMETVEIIIDESDKDGGTGANFIFDWNVKPGSNKPVFEAVMISTYGRGLSFSTEGIEIIAYDH